MANVEPTSTTTEASEPGTALEKRKRRFQNRKPPPRARAQVFAGSNEVVRREYGKILTKVLKLRFVDHLSYTDIEAVMKKGGKLQISDDSIRDMCEEFSPLMADPEKVAAFKAMEPNLLDGARMLMVQGMVEQLSNPERRQTLDLSRLTYGYGILYDKQRLERGESTANVRTLSDLVREAHARPVNPEPEEAQIAGERT